MANNDITNQQLLNAVTTRFDSLEQRFDGIEKRFGSMEEMLAGVKNVVVGIADTMATSKELIEFQEELHGDFDNLELRLGRRIDTVLSARKITH